MGVGQEALRIRSILQLPSGWIQRIGYFVFTQEERKECTALRRGLRSAMVPAFLSAYFTVWCPLSRF